MTSVASQTRTPTTATDQPETDRDFMALVEPMRGELMAHCYRMLGSVHDAEDLVQETYIPGLARLPRVRGTLVAAHVDVPDRHEHLPHGAPEPVPPPAAHGLGAPLPTRTGALESRPEVTWLEPMPDTLVAGTAPQDPEATAVTHDSIRIAFIAALQHLTPTPAGRPHPSRRAQLAGGRGRHGARHDRRRGQQRTAAGSAHVEKLAPADEASSQLSADDPEVKAKLERYVAAFEAYDINTIVEMLATDAIWDMPPFTGWYQGNEAIGQLIASKCPATKAGDMRLVPTTANGQPAYGLYMRSADGRMRPLPAAAADHRSERRRAGHRLLRPAALRDVRQLPAAEVSRPARLVQGRGGAGQRRARRDVEAGRRPARRHGAARPVRPTSPTRLSPTGSAAPPRRAVGADQQVVEPDVSGAGTTSWSPTARAGMPVSRVAWSPSTRQAARRSSTWPATRHR